MKNNIQQVEQFNKLKTVLTFQDSALCILFLYEDEYKAIISPN